MEIVWRNIIIFVILHYCGIYAFTLTLKKSTYIVGEWSNIDNMQPMKFELFSLCLRYDGILRNINWCTSPLGSQVLQSKSATQSYAAVFPNDSAPEQCHWVGERSPRPSQIQWHGRRSAQFFSWIFLLTHGMAAVQKTPRRQKIWSKNRHEWFDIRPHVSLAA